MASPVQFSIRQLLIAVAFVALGMAALLNANIWWHSAIWLLTVLLLSAAVLLAIYRRDQSRAFWIGFLVFGWIQVAAILAPFDGGGINPGIAQSYAARMVCERAYPILISESRRESVIPDPSFQGGDMSGSSSGGMMGGSGGMPMAGGSMQPMSGMSMGPGGAGMMPGGGMPGMAMGMGGMGAPMIANPSYVDQTTFINVGHALWLIVLATIGGKLAQWIYRTRPATQPAS